LAITVGTPLIRTVPDSSMVTIGKTFVIVTSNGAAQPEPPSSSAPHPVTEKTPLRRWPA
jgi:hypothetical protein